MKLTEQFSAYAHQAGHMAAQAGKVAAITAAAAGGIVVAEYGARQIASGTMHVLSSANQGLTDFIHPPQR